MGKSLKRVGFCFLIALSIWSVMLVRDKQTLRKELIRLHVVGASDTREDQALKLRVKNAVVEGLQANMASLTDMEEAKNYLRQQLPKIEALANRVLQESGSRDTATVSLRMEEFGTRVYDTFTLPAGIYESLRITIGPGEGKNWWCVVFPTLCVGATVGEFEESAHCAGFSEALTGALTGEEPYEVRFFVLDALGRLENFLHRG